jgi:hypothetical protein
MRLINCPECGKLVVPAFPLHQCVKPRQRIYRITRITKTHVWLRWKAFGWDRRGLSMRVPIAEFRAKWKRLPQREAVRISAMGLTTPPAQET